jgi:hypothetical protein
LSHTFAGARRPRVAAAREGGGAATRGSAGRPPAILEFAP